jgi:hypothetical protein
MATTYSFLDVVATLSAPTGSIDLGYGAGTAPEGITVEMLEDKDAMAVGSDGDVMHSLRASNAGRITVRLLKTSPTNNLLSIMYNAQRLVPSVWGNNIVSVRDILQGDTNVLSKAAFTRQGHITYAQDANMNEWSFIGKLTQLLGSGIPDISAV